MAPVPATKRGTEIVVDPQAELYGKPMTILNNTLKKILEAIDAVRAAYFGGSALGPDKVREDFR
jgi:hypothetical protein